MEQSMSSSSKSKPPTHPSIRTGTATALSTDHTIPFKSDFPRSLPPFPPPLQSSTATTSEINNNLLFSQTNTQYGASFLDENPSTTSSRNHSSRPAHTIAASTSFFGIPLSFSSFTLRSTPSHQNLNQTHSQYPDLDLTSLYVIYVVTLIAEAARGLLLPSTWPYYQSLGGTKASLGIFVASFSLGRMFTTIPLGYLSDSFSISSVLLIASILQIIGHFGYAISKTLPFLFVSRLLVGFGSATMSVCRAHLTRAIPPNQRTHHFAYLSGLQFIGFAVLPGLGGLMTFLPTFQPFSFLSLNGYTYPAHFLVLANLFCIYLIIQFYTNPPPVAPRIPSIRSASLTRLNAIEQPSADLLALTICLLLNIIFRGVIAEFETVSIPFLMEQYHMSFDVGSYYLSFIGGLGLIVYLSFKTISSRFTDRFLVLAGLSFIIIGCIPLSISFISSYLPPLLYVSLLALTWSLAFPIGQTAVLALFSKILYGLPAGGLLGIFSASGSVARLLMAVFAGQIWNKAGREAVFVVIVAYSLLALCLALISYRRLTPRNVAQN